MLIFQYKFKQAAKIAKIDDNVLKAFYALNAVTMSILVIIRYGNMSAKYAIRLLLNCMFFSKIMN